MSEGLIVPALRRRVFARSASGKRFYRPRFLIVVTVATALFLLVPNAIVVFFSFNSVKSLAVFHGFSLRWYSALAHDETTLSAVRASLHVAMVTTLVATLLGTLLALGLTRSRRMLSAPVEFLTLLNVVTPEIATAVALLLLFASIHLPLSLTTVAIGHITFSIAYVMVIVRARLISLPRALEQAAMDLGASPTRAILRVTVPLLWPAILGAAILVFLLSFDDFVTSYFTSGIGAQPLPIVIYGMIRFGLSPEINAIGALMMGGTITFGAIMLVLLRRRNVP